MGRPMDELEEALEKLAKKRAHREARERRQIQKELAQGLIDDHEDDEAGTIKPPQVRTRVVPRIRLRLRLAPYRYDFLSAAIRKCSA